MAVNPPAQTIRARVMTRALRRSPWWASFREELSRRGLAPDDVVLVDGFDEDDGVDVGLLYTPGKRLVAWRRRYFDDDPGQDRILEWDDITDRWAGTVWSHQAGEFLQAIEHTRTIDSV